MTTSDAGNGGPIGPTDRYGYDLLHRRRNRLTVILVAVLVVVLVARLHQARAPGLPPNCHQAALRLSSASAARSSVISWTATGPAAVPVLLGVDVGGYTRGPAGQYVATPAKGVSSHDMEALPQVQQLSGCRGSGQLTVTVPAGHHEVSLFQLSGSGSTKVATAPLTVTR